MNFQEWAKGYENEYERELKEWQEKSKLKALIPENFRERLLQKYVAYRNETGTKRLVIVTWVLAIATILLSIITLTLK